MSKHQNPVAWLTDSLLNMVSGLGASQDKNAHNMHVLNLLTQQDVEAAYRSDWISRKVVDLPAYDMTRARRQWQAKKDVIEAVELEEKRLQMWPHLFKALKLARLHGGSALIIGGPGQMDEPLAPRDVTRGSLRFLLPVRRYDLRTVSRELDLYSPYFGGPQMYELLNYGNRRWRIHPSRVIVFKGNEIPGDKDDEGSYWGDSVLQVVNDAVINAGVAQAGIASLIHEAKIDIIQVPNLMENLSTDEYSQALVKRFMLANQAKSMQNALILDAEEKWERKQINFTQLPDVLKLYLQVASAACDIPATRLVGLSPQGLNATGDTEERMYYDRISGEQVSWLQPKLDGLDEMIIRSARGNSPRDVFYTWNPLWQMSAKEAAEVAKNKAETIKTIKETGLQPPSALAKAQANQLIEDSQFPGYEDAYEAIPEEELDRIAQEAGQQQTAKTKGPGTNNGDVTPADQPTGSPAPYTGGPTGNGETE